MSVLGVILVRIFPAFFRIRTEYGEILRENAVKMRTRITPNRDTFYAVIHKQSSGGVQWKKSSKEFYKIIRKKNCLIVFLKK